jgi:putative tricarboxylic transport membrane protein
VSDDTFKATHDRAWDVARLVLDLVVLLLAAWALRRGLTFRPLAAYFPVAAAGMIAVFVAVQGAIDLSNFLRGRPVIIGGMDVQSPILGLGVRGILIALRYLAWFVAFIVMVWAFGVFVSGAVFVGAFLKLEARWSWPGVAVTVAAVLVATYLMLGGLELGVPRGWLQIGHGLL